MAGSGASEIFRILEELAAELPARVRGSRERVEEQTLDALRGLVRELGLATREDLDELELRVAQLEHRLGLLEHDRDLRPLPPAS